MVDYQLGAFFQGAAQHAFDPLKGSVLGRSLKLYHFFGQPLIAVRCVHLLQKTNGVKQGLKLALPTGGGRAKGVGESNHLLHKLYALRSIFHEDRVGDCSSAHIGDSF